jgi:molecular chaperone IbpA
MTNLKANTLFPRSSFVGFDHLFQDLDWVARHATDTYPPHNIVRVSENDYRIEIAVAGFTFEDLDIEQDERTLTVKGEKAKKEEVDETAYIHRGISQKNFKRVFRLSEYVYVDGASLEGGILAITLKFELPEEKRPRKIDIS